MRDRIGLGPDRLAWPDDIEAFWSDPALVLSQTCGLPLAMRLHLRLRVLGALDIGHPGIAPGQYASHLVTRVEDDRPLAEAARRVAVNAADSQSGWGALHATGLPIGSARVTGSHAASMEAVAEGEADLAAIDVLTWRLGPHPRLRVRATTRPTPGTPLVTARTDLVGPLRAALSDAVPALSAPQRRRSGLRGFVPFDAAPYLALRVPPPPP